MHVLVTGAAGYLGSELVRRADEQGLNVRATFHDRRPALPADWLPVDVRDEQAVRAAVDGVDCVVHAAYRMGGADQWATNVEGAALVARAARAAGARLIHLSSDLVFSGDRGRYREEDEPAPVNDYGRSKAEAELRVAAEHPDASLVRTSLLYGAAQPGPQERLAAEGTTFFVDEIRSPVHVGDLAEAILELAGLEHRGPIHLGGADDVSRYDFALLLGADPARIEAGRTTPDRAPNVSLDSSRARALLRTRLRGVHEVLG